MLLPAVFPQRIFHGGLTLIGKGVVLKTTARTRLRVRIPHPPPDFHFTGKRRLTVWHDTANVAGTNPCEFESHRFRLSLFAFEPVAQWNQERNPAEVEVARSSRAGFISLFSELSRRSPTGRGACLRNKRLRVRISRSACGCQTATFRTRGVGQVGRSRLTFNQESASSNLARPIKISRGVAIRRQSRFPCWS